MKRFAAFIISAAVMLSGYAGNVQVFAAADSETDDYVLRSVQNEHPLDVLHHIGRVTKP